MRWRDTRFDEKLIWVSRMLTQVLLDGALLISIERATSEATRTRELIREVTVNIKVIVIKITHKGFFLRSLRNGSSLKINPFSSLYQLMSNFDAMGNLPRTLTKVRRKCYQVPMQLSNIDGLSVGIDISCLSQLLNLMASQMTLGVQQFAICN